MQEKRGDKSYLKIAQLLAVTNIQSVLSDKCAKSILLKEGNFNFQIPDDTFLGTTKPELLGSTILHLTYKENKLNLFNLLLKHGVNFNLKNHRGSTILHQIIEDTYEKEAERSELKVITENPYVTSILDALVKSVDCYDLWNEKGITIFHVACMANHKASVDLFLKNKVNINETVAKDSPIFPGYTALHFATRFSNLKIVKILLERGATHDIKDAKGMTPLHILIKRNIEIADHLNKSKVVNAEQLTSQRKINEDIIHMLMSEQEDYVIDDTNLSCLHVACVLASSQITEDILGNAEQINQAVNQKLSLFAGNTALHFAALCDVEKVKLLLSKGANIHRLNANNLTAFDLCIERCEIQDICEIIQSLPDWNQVEMSVTGRKLLDLPTCLQSGDLSLLQTKKELQFNPRDSASSSLLPACDLLHLAVILSERGCKNDVMLVEKVIRHSTPIYRIADSGISPLHLAFRLKKTKVVGVLLRACECAINYADSDDLSHLHIACAAGVTSAVEKLLLLGSTNVNLQVQTSFEWYRYSPTDSSTPQEVYIPKGSTPLHVAVIVGHCEAMKLLLARGADIYARDEHGMTPIHWLVASDNPISPAAGIFLSMSRPISTTSSTNRNKRFANSALKECITRTGLSHLHVACFANNVAAVEKLLEDDDANINATSLCTFSEDAKRFPGKRRYAGYTPLHFALEVENSRLIRLLIQRGANVLMSNPMKHSIPLYEAFTGGSSPCADVIRQFFEDNKSLQLQVEDYTGFTILHFCCCTLDDEAAGNLLNDGAADVNKSMLASSPIWPEFTPLHVLMTCYRASSRNADNLLRLLLYHGADVTLTNTKKETPLHMAYDLDVETCLRASLLKTLVRSQKNFNVNPRNSGGLTHFHVACALGDICTIQKFLKSNNFDVDQRIDCFYRDSTNTELNGCTPLHLLLSHPLSQDVQVAATLKAVFALIKVRADVRAENVYGNTPLHLAAKHHSNCVDLLAKIVDVGGDVYAKNILGQTPLEMMLNSKDATVAGVEFFLGRGYCANTFNPITQKGFVAMIFSTHAYFRDQRPIFELMLKACGSILDRMGRTVIHNAVSTSTPVISKKFYAKTIESLSKIVDIDHRDNLGRTALHVAAQFKNHRGVFALLQAGADVNIVDANKKTAFLHAFETSPFFEGSQDDTKKVIRVFSSYLQKLNVCLLEVHAMNHSALGDAAKNYNVDVEVAKRFYDELEKLKKVEIGCGSITLLDCISGTNTESVSLRVSRLQHNVIDNLLEKVDKARFWESLGIIRLQCRKLFRKSVIV